RRSVLRFLQLTKKLWANDASRWAFLGISMLASIVATLLLPQKYSYTGMSQDFDYYMLAIAADLRTVGKLRGMSDDSALLSAHDLQAQVFKRDVVWNNDGGWLLEPGAWRDHPDMAFAGNSMLRGGLSKAPVNNIGWDTSHFHRMPLFLYVMEHAETDQAAKDDLGKLRTGLAAQFNKHVLVPADDTYRLPRTNNFMDGSNGVYRYGYEKRGDDFGYGPYQLSGTFLLGWWSFLNDPTVNSQYAVAAERMPMTDAEKELYKLRFSNDAWFLMSDLASKLKIGDTTSWTPTDKESKAFSSFVVPTMNGPFWRGDSAQGTSFSMMVPMHAAFWGGPATWRNAYSDHFDKFVSEGAGSMKGGRLSRLHYLEFAARYLALTAEYDSARFSKPLYDTVYGAWASLWNDGSETVSQTGWGEPKFNGYERYLRWKVGQPRAGIGS
ncbi:MAG: hypothetical protein ABUL49_01945, partial [bacterium]